MLGRLEHGEDVGGAVDDDLDPDAEDKEHESVVVFDAHAVVDPGAVMVESFDTLAADGAVSRSGRLDHLALWAQVSWVDVSQKFDE